MAKKKSIVVIGASAGGNLSLPDLVSQFTEKMNIAVLVVMHLSKHEVGEMLVNRLKKNTTYACTLATDGETIEAHHIYVAVPDQHLIIKGNRILLGRGPMENRYRPSIDTLFRSAAVHHGSRVIGIILSGMLEDGAAGMAAIKLTGGTCIVQKPEEAKYPDMPLAVLHQLAPDYTIPVSEMGAAILESLKKKTKTSVVKVPSELQKEAEIAERVSTGIHHLEGTGEWTSYGCPDCGGAMVEIKDNGGSRYRCHVGHAYNEEGLLSAMQATTESALWTALRILEERKNLLGKIREKESAGGNRSVASSYSRRVKELDQQITQLRQALFYSSNN